jgi:opacity protein-like surface antigen
MIGKRALAEVAAATVVAVALCIPAGAADLALRHKERHYAKEPVVIPPPLYNWAGFYVGAEDVAGTGPTFSTNPSGVLGGFQVGYNFLFSPNWLLGIEAEFDVTSAQGTGNFTTATTTGSFTSDHNWYDTLAGRLGYVQGPWLYYMKGGAAWMNANNNVVTDAGGGSAVDITRSGYTIGGGVEYMLTPQW